MIPTSIPKECGHLGDRTFDYSKKEWVYICKCDRQPGLKGTVRWHLRGHRAVVWAAGAMLATATSVLFLASHGVPFWLDMTLLFSALGGYNAFVLPRMFRHMVAVL